MPGRHINDHQMRLYMKHRLTDAPSTAAARAGFSTATAYRIEDDPSSLSGFDPDEIMAVIETRDEV